MSEKKPTLGLRRITGCWWTDANEEVLDRGRAVWKKTMVGQFE
jgi:hypothetical protein